MLNLIQRAGGTGYHFVSFSRSTCRFHIDIFFQLKKFQIQTKSVSLNPAHEEGYSIQHYVIKFVNDLRQIGGFLRVLQFPPPIKLTTTILLKYC